MTQKENKARGKSAKTAGSIVLYVSAAVVAVLAIIFLVSNIILFKNVINQYVAQGYPEEEVRKQLIQSQLVPGIIQPLATYGGLAILLFAAGLINQKVSDCLALLAKNEACEACEAYEVCEADETDEAAGEGAIEDPENDAAEMEALEAAEEKAPVDPD